MRRHATSVASRCAELTVSRDDPPDTLRSNCRNRHKERLLQEVRGTARFTRVYRQRGLPSALPTFQTNYQRLVRSTIRTRGVYDAAVVGFVARRVTPSNRSSTASGSSRSAEERFSRRCASDDVPGMSRRFGRRRRSHASATCIGSHTIRVGCRTMRMPSTMRATRWHQSPDAGS